jgi:Na+-translocating ferredoxin:NAD+ oxidoreductase RnfG subunit
MTRRILPLLFALFAAPALAHITPPVALTFDRDAVSALLPGAKRYFVREVRLSDAEREAIRQQTGWTADEEFYRFYLGRDDQGHDVGAVAFLSDYTIHGPVRVAVGLAPDGRIRGAKVIEVTEETYPWVKSLIDRGFLDQFQGSDARAALRTTAGDGSMVRFYGDVIRGLVQRGAVLYDVTVRRRGAAPQ